MTVMNISNQLNKENDVNTFFTLSLFEKIMTKIRKNLTHLSARFTLLTLLILSSFGLTAQVNVIESQEVAQVKIDLGEKIAFHSTSLGEQREFFVRLPKSYQESKRNYPVIYLLDANNETLTYMKNLYFHSVAQIERLMEHRDIPESIIVGIPFKSSQWFSNVVSNSEPFSEYLTQELSSYINDNYRTLNNNTLVGQSYSALFVLNSFTKNNNTFNNYVAIEPVLGGGALEETIQNYQNVSVKDRNLQIIIGGAIMLPETEELYQQIGNASGNNNTISLEIFDDESHGSVYYPALNSSLRKVFSDYRQPSKVQILASNFDHKALLSYFDNKMNKYQVEMNEREFQSALFDTIFYQLMAKKFVPAFDLWHLWKTPNKIYNANRIINYFLRNDDTPAAIEFLVHLTKAMPKSVIPLHRLANVYKENQQIKLSTKYRLKIETLLTDIFSQKISAQQENALNRYGYNLIQENKTLEAISIFTQLTLANPESINAYDSLADGYEAANNYPEAIKAQEQTIVLAKQQGITDIATLQQKINRFKNKKLAD